MTHRRILLVICVAFLAGADRKEETAPPIPPAAARDVDFVKDVAPIFAASCMQCHSGGTYEADFSIETRAKMIEGGASDAAIVPGNSAESLLIQLVAGQDAERIMPTGIGPGNNLLAWTQLGGDTMMQALDSWQLHQPDREPQLDSHNPATGIELAYNLYGTRFFELYVSDLDAANNGALDAAGHPLIDDLRAWNTTLTSIPEPAGLAPLLILLGLRRNRA